MKSFLAKYNIADKVVAVGVSGGADSLALVLRLRDAGVRVIALTVDHGLREESRKEADYVANIMQKNGIDHCILTWKGEKPSAGIEELARQARYRLMFDFCKREGISILATGHHRRDQAETFLMRLQRGSGVYGLSGILPVSERDGIVIIRPQLEDDPENLKGYLRAKNIAWIEDPMNDSDDFLRVKIRKFLPELEKIGIDEKRLAETASVICRTRMFLQSNVDLFIKNHVRCWEDIVAALSWKLLNEQPQEIAMLILGQLVKKIGKVEYLPEAAEVGRILTLHDDFKGCTLGNCELFIAAKRLWIIPQDKENQLMSKAEWKNFEEEYPYYKNSGFPYKVRRALKKYMKDKNG